MGMFKVLTPKEVEEFKQWARKNYTPFHEINGVWHPTIQEECVLMNKEAGNW